MVKGCPAYRDYNVFGLSTNRGCCYNCMKFCDDVENCNIKELVKLCKNTDTIESRDVLSILEGGK